jgi:hypothetical protein
MVLGRFKNNQQLLLKGPPKFKFLERGWKLIIFPGLHLPKISLKKLLPGISLSSFHPK